MVLDSLIKNLALSQNIIVELKKEKRKNCIKEKYPKMLKVFRIKIICFFVCAFIILSSFWYYVTCFCGIYRNTQIHLIKDSLFSFMTSLITPFALNLFPGIFRILGLKKKSKCLFGFSKLLQIL